MPGRVNIRSSISVSYHLATDVKLLQQQRQQQRGWCSTRGVSNSAVSSQHAIDSERLVWYTRVVSSRPVTHLSHTSPAISLFRRTTYESAMSHRRRPMMVTWSPVTWWILTSLICRIASAAVPDQQRGLCVSVLLTYCRVKSCSHHLQLVTSGLLKKSEKKLMHNKVSQSVSK